MSGESEGYRFWCISMNQMKSVYAKLFFTPFVLEDVSGSTRHVAMETQSSITSLVAMDTEQISCFFYPQHGCFYYAVKGLCHGGVIDVHHRKPIFIRKRCIRLFTLKNAPAFRDTEGEKKRTWKRSISEWTHGTKQLAVYFSCLIWGFAKQNTAKAQMSSPWTTMSDVLTQRLSACQPHLVSLDSCTIKVLWLRCCLIH